MGISTNELSRLRDELLAKRALQQQAKIASDKAIENLKPLIQSLNTDYSENLLKMGLDISFLNAIDYDRLGTDIDYLNFVKTKINELAQEMQRGIEVLLNVQN